MEKPVTSLSLERIRDEIDAIDRRLLELLERRFAAIEAIKTVKRQSSPQSSPMRPAREALMLRRLNRLRPENVPAQLLVRLWRTIISAATSQQGDVSVHVTAAIAASHRLRDLVTGHFVGLAMNGEVGAEQVVRRLSANVLDVGVVETTAAWIEPLQQQSGLSVIGALPVLAQRDEVPALVILGYAAGEATEDDQTLVAVSAGTARPEEALWEVQAGTRRCVSLAGFLEESDPKLRRLRGAGEAKILGRYPVPLESRP